MKAIDTLEGLKTLFDEASVEDFIDQAGQWSSQIAAAIDDLEAVSDQIDKDQDRISELQNQVDELQEEGLYDDDDEPRIDVEVNGLPDQMKLEHLQEIFGQYTLAEIESALPKR